MFGKKSPSVFASSPGLGRGPASAGAGAAAAAAAATVVAVAAIAGGATSPLSPRAIIKSSSQHNGHNKLQDPRKKRQALEQRDNYVGQNGLAIDRKSLSKFRKQLQKMSTDELEMFSSTSDTFVLDCLVDRNHSIKKLQQERDDLKKQVSNLAKFNYAREPEFVRDRTKLRELSDEVAGLIRHATSRHVEPTISRLNSVLTKLTSDAIKYEELSESMAQDFLVGKTSYNEFIDQYVKLRKETSKKRINVDKLTKEKTSLASNGVQVTTKLLAAGSTFGADSPVPTPRQRKRVSFNK